MKRNTGKHENWSAHGMMEERLTGDGEVMVKVKHWELIKFEDLPDWLRDNEFIRTRHRPELRSYEECYRSILMLHTETGNIWTHLFGCIVFLGLFLYFFFSPEDLILKDELVFIFFFLGAILCLGFSFTFHTVMCHSTRVNSAFNKLDYTGISLLTVGSYIPWTYYGFYCQPTTQAVYMVTISLLCILTIIVTMADRFATPIFRPIRALLFICLGCFGVIPFCHFTVEWGWQEAVTQLRADLMAGGGGLYILGAVLYGARIPERLLPGYCDLWGQSHQIFHVLVVAGALAHFKGLSDMARYRISEAGSCIG